MKHVGGAELNVASVLGMLGLNSAVVSKVELDNLLASYVRNILREAKVSEEYLVEDTSADSRLGLYYYEYGSYPRKPRVVYDERTLPSIK